MPKDLFKKGKIPWNKNKKGLQAAWNRGKKLGELSDEHKIKISEGLKKAYKKGERKCTFPKIPWHKGTKGIIKAWNKNKKGTHFSPTTEFKKGQHISPKTEFKKGQNLGENHFNWKGGVTSENNKIRNSIESRLWREAVFARDNWTCQKYGIRGGNLVVHHIQNFTQFPELRTSIENGITLSKKAHKEFHKKYGRQNNTKEQLNEFLI